MSCLVVVGGAKPERGSAVIPIAAGVVGGGVAVLLVVAISLALAVWVVRNRRSKHGMWVYTVSTSTVNHSVSDIHSSK